jgi:uncharacterized protein CbrC (UPF0167 family)
MMMKTGTYWRYTLARPGQPDRICDVEHVEGALHYRSWLGDAGRKPDGSRREFRTGRACAKALEDLVSSCLEKGFALVATEKFDPKAPPVLLPWPPAPAFSAAPAGAAPAFSSAADAEAPAAAKQPTLPALTGDGPLGFRYFHAPASDIDGLVKRSTCPLCKRRGPALALPSNPDSAAVCLPCLRDGRLAIAHDTEAGLLTTDPAVTLHDQGNDTDDDPPSAEACAELARTPPYATWQGEGWLVHCRDFMVYLGNWSARELRRHAKDDDQALDLVREMVEVFPDGFALDDSFGPDTETFLHVFQCRHCGTARAQLDGA